MPSNSLVSVHVNGARLQTGAGNLRDLLREQGFTAGRVATAHNGNFVPAGARADTRIESGDAIEVVSARQGG